MEFLIALNLSFFLAIILTLVVKKIALKLKIVDQPDKERKIHKKPIPLLGGIAIFLSFFIILSYFSFFTDFIIRDYIAAKHIIGIIIASLIIIFGGFLDDKYNLKPGQQIIFPIIAILIIIACGIGIDHIRNPFGGTIRFDQMHLVLFEWRGIPYKLTLLADLFTMIWLLGMTYTTKLLDGLDGLVSGISLIGCLIIFGISISERVNQPNVALIALILSGAFLGFLIFNWHPAKIFLGEGGSLFAGFIIGVLAILSGSKVATTLLIMGIPILDVAWTIIRRLREGKNPFKFSDRKHLHFRLLDLGLSQEKAVLFLYLLTALFGSLALFLQTFGKLIALFILGLVMVIIIISLLILYKRKAVKL